MPDGRTVRNFYGDMVHEGGMEDDIASFRQRDFTEIPVQCSCALQDRARKTTDVPLVISIRRTSIKVHDPRT